ncbi:alpha/beta fold hydrolase [Streptomyces sp. NPDC046870]|uniref:alpha/beta fold hydrolase n=1 Tax=Streptomyces sp. NPDC046870 TaxID=3155135 RepID=UPI0034534322
MALVPTPATGRRLRKYRHTLHLMDLRGRNETDGGPDATAYRREELGEDVVALAGALGARPHLAGHSTGGRIARGAALAAPRRSRP